MFNSRRALRRQLEAGEYVVRIMRQTEEKNGIPVVLFHAYADAVERYDLGQWRPREDRETLGETILRVQWLYEQMLDAMAAYTLKGGGYRWNSFDHAVCEFVGFAWVAVETMQRALHTSAVGLSEVIPGYRKSLEPTWPSSA